jgi:hypothetical protein
VNERLEKPEGSGFFVGTRRKDLAADFDQKIILQIFNKKFV